MKTIKHIILAVLVIITAMSFVSCQKESYNGQEQVTVLDPNHTEDLFRLAVENGYSLYSYSEKGSYHHFIFHDVTVINSIKDKYPEGISQLDIPKAIVKNIEMGAYSCTVEFNSGKKSQIHQYGELLLTLAENIDTILFRNHQAVIPFKILATNGEKLTMSKASLDGCDIKLESINETDARLIIQPDNAKGNAKITFTNGLASARCNIVFDTYKIHIGDIPTSFGDGEEFEFEGKIHTQLGIDDLAVESDPWIQAEIVKKEDNEGNETLAVKANLTRNETNKDRKGKISVIHKQGMIDPFVIELNQPYALFNREGMVPFTDKAFKETILEIADTNGDFDISPEEALEVKELNISGKGIHDLTGLNYFKNVWKLDAQDNDIVDGTIIKELPLLYWLDLKGNKNLRTFDVTGCTFFFEHCEFEVTDDLIYYTTRQQVFVTNASDPMCEYSKHVRDDRQSTNWSRQDEIITVKKHTKGSGYPIIFSSFSLIDVDINDGSYERFMMDKINFMLQNKGDKEFFDEWGDYLDIYIVLHIESNRNRNDYDEECWEKGIDGMLEYLEIQFCEKFYPFFAQHPEQKYQMCCLFQEMNPLTLKNEAQSWWYDSLRQKIGVLSQETTYHTKFGEDETFCYGDARSITNKMFYTQNGWVVIAECDKEKIIEIITDPNY